MGASISRRSFLNLRQERDNARLRLAKRDQGRRRAANPSRALPLPAARTLAVALLAVCAVGYAGISVSRVLGAGNGLTVDPGYLPEAYMCRETNEPLAFAEARATPFEHEGRRYWEAAVCTAENCPGRAAGGMLTPFPDVPLHHLGRRINACPHCVKARLGYGTVERYWPPVNMTR